MFGANAKGITLDQIETAKFIREFMFEGDLEDEELQYIKVIMEVCKEQGVKKVTHLRAFSEDENYKVFFDAINKKNSDRGLPEIGLVTGRLIRDAVNLQNERYMESVQTLKSPSSVSPSPNVVIKRETKRPNEVVHTSSSDNVLVNYVHIYTNECNSLI